MGGERPGADVTHDRPELRAEGEESPAPPISEPPADEPPVEQPLTDEPPVEPPAEDEEPEGASARPARRDRLAELEERLSAQETELRFYRAGQQQPAAPAQPAAQVTTADGAELIRRFTGGYQVSGADLLPLGFTPEAAEIAAERLNTLLATAVAGGAGIALSQARAEFGQYLQANQAQQHQAQRDMALRQEFYTQFPDLEPFVEIVQATARELYDSDPRAKLDRQYLKTETARRTKATLKERGITPGSAPRASARRASRSFSDLGGGGGGAGGGSPAPKRQSAREKQMRAFERDLAETRH